ncbi:undecaprenyldiphospho-muramoylpentapeptide beta-N-acetylglucosaminyltransferase [Paenibacillus doosanensis]|uniref:UDP-N-acetylglucosamine--N-acetylmuramyl-(pentapeptide) pyrophosphoryl-undecaprenol N-acetylglucosamine transferase n=1 Tax=Paenibacillus konkukensis TaxID=2020716 RepID=A0ABY4S0U1_9BACL|nr:MULTISPECIES: undecaprenyldiphospho-muramoylpentapeptide beta-N-acetylglucosaminyltransferase [Paenibacillus]MCS7459266.1 undecaprenyldiphospho-muramoylpentapeptide beta-N-acetylglucosaminyltransferase [Paenibacillus doosanensis]UQZ87059.1 UDP-N-acetylglucosamine--N-acetylmuramyl-(pentapeptide) pyrophosphoryl-undecaprenol N-acetylglucosamine transferase [Paenibacillus konkukensis]
MKTIVFTGGGSAGHVTPNLAIIAKLKQLGWDIQYIGSKEGIEKEIIQHAGIPFHHISSGKLRRYFDLKNIKDPFKVVKGIGEAYLLLRRLKPSIVFSKGGFVSVPVIIASWLNRIPVISHESDMTPGLANKISIPFVQRICVNFPESLQHIKGGKGICTGLPIREQILRGKASKGLELCDFHKQKPVLLVMGGSLGAQKINAAVRESLGTLLERYQIVHICGKGQLDESLTKRRGYRQFEYVNEELADLLAMSDLVVSRAGATSIFEFLALGKPMLLIPLTRQASRGDQLLNAASFEKKGYARVLFEEQLSVDTLVSGVNAVYDGRSEMAANIRANEQAGATAAIIELIQASSLK